MYPLTNDGSSSLKVDLCAGYDVFANKDRPLEEVQAELGIEPLVADAA